MIINIPIYILRRALVIINQQIIDIDTCKDWPEDKWIGLGQFYDLNLYQGIDDDNNTCISAVIYQVVNGNTVTDNWQTIFRMSYE